MDKYKPLILILVTLCAVYAALSFFVLPGIAHEKTLSFLSKAGFETAFMPKPAASFGYILYPEAAFDKDSFSNAKVIRVSYDPVTLLTAGALNDVEIGGLALTGDWAGADKNFSVAGMRAFDPSSLAAANIGHLSLVNASLSLLTERQGGIDLLFTLDGNVRNGTLDFQGQARTAQPFLEMHAGAHGTINSKSAEITLDIEDGRFELPGDVIRASRLSGKIEIGPAAQSSAQIKAGAMSVFNLPWNNANASVKFSGLSYTASIEAQSAQNRLLISHMQITGNGDGVASLKEDIEAGQASFLTDMLEGMKDYAPLHAALMAQKKTAPARVLLTLDHDDVIAWQILDAGGAVQKSGSVQASPH